MSPVLRASPPETTFFGAEILNNSIKPLHNISDQGDLTLNTSANVRPPDPISSSSYLSSMLPATVT